MTTSRQLFEDVQAKFEHRDGEEYIRGTYYNPVSYPGGCAIGCLFSLESRISLQAECDVSGNYSIDEIWSDNVPELSELKGKYSLTALKAVQLLHDCSNYVQHFKDALASALLKGVMYAGLELGYVSLDEEIDELH